MKKYQLNIITYSAGVMLLCLLTTSVAQAGEKEGIVRFSDMKQQPVTQSTQPVRSVSYNQSCESCNQRQDTSWQRAPVRRSQTCTSCKNTNFCGVNCCSECGRSDRKICEGCGKCDKCCKCRPLKPNKVGLLNRLLYCIIGKDEYEECDDDEFEVEYDAEGNEIEGSDGRRRSSDGRRRKRKEKHIRSGHYTKVYSVNPWYDDPRNGKVYAAKNYGIPMTVPLAPNVEHTYNYGWGIPSSRLTPISKPPQRFQAPYPARRPPVYDPHHGRHRIETPLFHGLNRPAR